MDEWLPRKRIISLTSTLWDVTQPNFRMTKTCILICYEKNTELNSDNYEGIMTKLQTIIDDVYIYSQPDECVDFLTETDFRKAFLIVSRNMGEQMVPVVHDIPRVDSIFIVGSKEDSRNDYISKWSKIKGFYIDMNSICQAVRMLHKQNNENDISISFAHVNQDFSEENLNEMDPSFMYTHFFKEFFLKSDHKQREMKDFLEIWRLNSNDNQHKSISEFEQQYRPELSILLYTKVAFIYETLNWCLRTLNVGIMLKMAFFLYDLHYQIENLYKKQVSEYEKETFIVYRGQGLSVVDFKRMQTNKNYLLSFNNFLSTSRDRMVAMAFAEGSSERSDTVGVLFNMTIHLGVQTTAFARIDKFSHDKFSQYPEEEEVLFSMHTVFYVREIRQNDQNPSIYEVNLQLTSDNDSQLRALTRFLDKELSGPNPRFQLAQLLLLLSQLDEAEKLFNVILEDTSTENIRGEIYNQLGYLKDQQGKSREAINLYKKSLDIKQRIFPENHKAFASTCNNIGGACMHLQEYKEALEYYEKARDVLEKTSFNDEHLAIVYNNIGGIHDILHEFSKALESFLKAHKIKEQKLPQMHPSLANSFNNIGEVYRKMGEYLKALEHFEKGLEIRERALPAGHRDIAESNNSMGAVYHNMEKYSLALEYYRKALTIQEQSAYRDPSLMVLIYNNIANVHGVMGEYLEALNYLKNALEYLEKASEIKESNSFQTHLSWDTIYSNIGSVYRGVGEYPKALDYFEKALEMQRKVLGLNHPSLFITYKSIGDVYILMNRHSEALKYFEQALKVQEETVHLNHPSLAAVHNDIGSVYRILGQYPKALEYLERALIIREAAVPQDASSLAESYNNIGALYCSIEKYSDALKYLERACSIKEQTLCPRDPSLANTYNNIGGVYRVLSQYPKALEYLKKALEIREIAIPHDHRALAESYNNIGAVYYNIEKCLEAKEYFEKALKMRLEILHPNQCELAESYENIGVVYYDMAQYSEALEYYEKARKIKQDTPSMYSSLVTTLNNIGEVYKKKHEYSKAVEHFEKALKVGEKVFPQNRSGMAQSYNSIGVVYYETAEYSKALECFEKVFRIQQGIFNCNHPSLIATCKNISETQKKISENSNVLLTEKKC